MSGSPSPAAEGRLRAAAQARWFGGIHEIDRERWDALALPLETPFLEWDWLRLLESSGSVGPAAGWIPCHLTLWEDGRLLAAAPLYIKLHSEGEFVFDRLWAEAARRLGRRYYPKLVGMSPFTPMIGYRFLTAPGEGSAALGLRLAAEIERFCRRAGLSGSAFHFVDPAWGEEMGAAGYRGWIHQSFLWENEGYGDLEAFLARFTSARRRLIRRERRALREQGILTRMIPGERLPPELYGRMWDFYAATNDRFGPWGCRYLTRSFFLGLAERFARRLVFSVACAAGREEDPLGMALLVRKGERLYGRYWGCREEIRYLHFETCYYRPIEWAIAEGVRFFDPGMGGEHKMLRGFRSVPNRSLHRFVDPVLQELLERHLPAVNELELEAIGELNAQVPFRRG